jgi:NAD+ kinase
MSLARLETELSREGRLRLAFLGSSAPEAQAALARLSERYQAVEPASADVLVALGGDGLMLQTLHAFMHIGKPIYGMHRGSVGFLMNEYREDDLPERVAAAKLNILYPLKMTARDEDGRALEALAINEVSLFRRIYQAARLSISVDGHVQLAELICDGVLVSTPAGSTAYNLSVGGPILPLSAPLLALTPISPSPPSATSTSAEAGSTA